MRSLHIRNISPETLEALKRLAASHHRSLQGELVFILEKAARMAPPLSPRRLQLHFSDTGVSETLKRSDIYEDYR